MGRYKVASRLGWCGPKYIVVAVELILVCVPALLVLNPSLGHIVPIMKNPVQLLDYEHWWNKDLNKLLPYKVPCVKEEIINKMEMQLEDSSNRNGNTRASAEQIIHHLQQLINEQKHEFVFPFSWNLKMYRYPPKKGEKTFEFSPQQLAIIEQVHMDNALKRTHNLEPCVLLNQLTKVETSHFVIVKCAKDTGTPFYLAEVVSNNADSSFTIQWWAPNALAKKKGGKYHNMAFEAQTTKHKITNRQRGAPQWRLKPHMDTIKYNTVYFGFSKLTRDRRLPAEVQRKLKGLSLISRHIKIKRM